MPEFQEHCVVCGSESFSQDKPASESLAIGQPFAVVKCKGCGFRWLNPRPTETEYTLLYDRAYAADDSKHAANELEWMRDYSLVPGDYETDRQAEKVRRFASRLEKIAKFSPGAQSVLEVGVGTGEFLRAAHDRGMDVTGLDLSEQSCKRVREQLNIEAYCGSLESYVPEARRFDVVHLHHVFEHLLDPERSLQQIRSLMTAEGMLALEIPNEFECLAYVVGRWLPGRPKPLRTLWSIAHPYFYARPHICRLVEGAGFRITHVTTFFGERIDGSRWPRAQNTVRYLADRLGGRGTNIELFAVPR